MVKAQTWLNKIKKTSTKIDKVLSGIKKNSLEDELKVDGFLSLKEINLGEQQKISRLVVKNCPELKKLYLPWSSERISNLELDNLSKRKLEKRELEILDFKGNSIEKNVVNDSSLSEVVSSPVKRKMESENSEELLSQLEKKIRVGSEIYQSQQDIRQDDSLIDKVVQGDKDFAKLSQVKEEEIISLRKRVKELESEKFTSKEKLESELSSLLEEAKRNLPNKILHDKLDRFCDTEKKKVRFMWSGEEKADFDDLAVKEINYLIELMPKLDKFLLIKIHQKVQELAVYEIEQGHQLMGKQEALPKNSL